MNEYPFQALLDGHPILLPEPFYLGAIAVVPDHSNQYRG